MRPNKFNFVLLLVALVFASNNLFAFTKSDKRIEFVPQGTAWIAGHSSMVYPASVSEPAATFKSRNGSDWKIKSYGPLANFKRVWGAGVPVGSKSMTDAKTANAASIDFWRFNKELLPTGIKVSDLELRANAYSDDMRVVSHTQTIQGLPVLGTNLFVAIKNNRIALAGSQCFAPQNIQTTNLQGLDGAQKTALSELAERGIKATVADAFPAIFPMILSDSYKLVTVNVVKMSTKGSGSWTAYIHAVKGTLLALRDERLFLSAKLRIKHHDRNPAGISGSSKASFVEVKTDMQTVNADVGGQFTAPASNASIDVSLKGKYTSIDNLSGDDSLKHIDGIVEGNSYTWEESSETGLAQLDAYAFIENVRQYLRSFTDDLDWLEAGIVAHVNENDVCNAYFDPQTNAMTFFKSGPYPNGGTCNNTAMLADVVYHEFGHGYHFNSSINLGSGLFDESVSEGFADFTAACITNDHHMAPYFFTEGGFLRDLEPDAIWPDDVAEDPHVTGLITGSTLWDLRKALRETLGNDAGDAAVQKIHRGMVRTAGDTATIYESALLADDDNGNISDGTPHFCTIYTVFGQHGLTEDFQGILGIKHEPITNYANPGHDIPVAAEIVFPQNECSQSSVGDVKLIYSSNGGDSWETLSMSSLDETHFATDIPSVEYGTSIRYRIEAEEVTTGKIVTKPDNPAEPFYYLYVGGLQEIVHDDFESMAIGWTHELVEGPQEQDGADDWQLGTPMSKGGDPSGAFSGTKAWGNDLGEMENWDGLYQNERINMLRSSHYDLSDYDNVRLQFRRWLTVEDAAYDKARLYVNDELVWSNSQSTAGDVHHKDKEWILFDIDISEYAAGQASVQIRWQIESDQGMQFGGWNIDDFSLMEMTDDVIIDGDDDPDGDDVIDGDEIDGDAIVDGDDTVDGDMPTDGDDSVEDGDESDKEDGDMLVIPPDGEGEGEGEGENEDDDDGEQEIWSENSGGCNSTPFSGGLFMLLALAALGLRRSRFKATK